MIVIGTGGHASNIVNLAFALDYSICGFIHNGESGQTHFGLPIFGDLNEIGSVDQYVFSMAIGNNYQREKYLAGALRRFPDLVFPTLVHPTCSIGPFSQIGVGTVVMPQTVIGTNVVVGDFCVLGNQSCAGHDSQLSDFSSLGPAATLGGNTTLGHRSAIGIGAKVREMVNIGDDSVLGANSFLNNDLGNNAVAYGTPARFERYRQASDNYLRQK